MFHFFIAAPAVFAAVHFRRRSIATEGAGGVAFRCLARTAAALVLRVALRKPVKARVARDARLGRAMLGAGAAEKDARSRRGGIPAMRAGILAIAIAHLPYFGRHRSMAHGAARGGTLEEGFGGAGEVH